MKISRRVLGGGAAGVLAVALAACSSSTSTAPTSASPTEAASSAPASSPAASSASPTDSSAATSSDSTICAGQTVTLVSTQKAGDKSVVDDMINNGLNAAQSQLGATVKYVEALDPSTYESTLANAAQAGSGIVATTFLDMGKPLQSAAKQFPDTKFIQIYGDPVDPALPNLRTVSYRYDEATYLSGLVAGAATMTNKIGYEGGMFVPGINTDFNSFKSSATLANPGVTVLPGEVGSFSDDAKAKEVVSALFAQGADIVQGDGPVIGLIEAAKDKGKYAIIGAPGLVDKAPANIMGVTFIYFGKSLFDQIKSACSADFTGGHVASGVADGVTGFYVPDQFIAQGDPAMVKRVQDALPAVTKAEADIKSGALVVPVVNTNP